VSPTLLSVEEPLQLILISSGTPAYENGYRPHKGDSKECCCISPLRDQVAARAPVSHTHMSCRITTLLSVLGGTEFNPRFPKNPLMKFRGTIGFRRTLVGKHCSSVSSLQNQVYLPPPTHMRSRISSGSIVSNYGLDDRANGRTGFDPRRGHRIFPLTSVSRPVLGPTQPPVQWVPGVLSPGIKARPGREADHSPPSSAEVKNE
jgi:hypothetical protein